MTDTLASLSLALIILFFIVLCALLEMLARRLRNVAASLATVRKDVQGVHQHCRLITPAVDGMNTNLYEVAAQLTAVGDLAEELAESSGT